MFDNYGLVEWQGAYSMIGWDIWDSSKYGFGNLASAAAGAAYSHATLKTKCESGKRGVVKVHLLGVTGDLGIGLTGKLTLEFSTLTCHAPMDPESFNGSFYLQSVGLPVAAITSLRIGSADCDATGMQISTDIFMASLFYGRAIAKGSVEECCED